jgi:hypothetical protein
MCMDIGPAQVLTSLGDFNAHIEYNRNPIDDMIRLLETFFNPSAPEKVKIALDPRHSTLNVIRLLLLETLFDPWAPENV